MRTTSQGVNILLKNLGKRFNNDWIFRNISFEFKSDGKYAIVGPNGSGKSTLIQIIAGNYSPSQGEILYSQNNNEIPVEIIFRHLSFASSYIDLPEEFSLQESIDFHFLFKNRIEGKSNQQIMDIANLTKEKNKKIKNFSSGMKQRIRLMLSIFADTPMLLLDEPTTNLDKEGREWYKNMIDQYVKNRLLIICSNQNHEIDMCPEKLQLENWKK